MPSLKRPFLLRLVLLAFANASLSASSMLWETKTSDNNNSGHVFVIALVARGMAFVVECQDMIM